MRASLRCLAFVVALAGLARPVGAFVQLNPPSVWPDGDITMHLQLGPLNGSLSDGSASWNAAARAAFDLWNPHMNRVKFATVADSSAAVGDGNGFNNVVFSSTIFGRAYGDSVLAVTTHWRVGSRRVEADVLFNTKYTWDSYRGPLRSGVNTAEFTRVAIHEFGHALGLGHPDQDGQNVAAIMNSTAGNIDGLQTDDTNGARFIYADRTGLELPSILIPLASTNVVAGANIELSVTVGGTPPFQYVWTKDRIRQINQSSKLTLANAQTGAAGTYAVTVTNSAGSVTSEAVVKITTFTAVPTILVQPANVSVVTGFNATLTVGADGTFPLRFQWFKNGAPFGPVSESNSINLSSVQLADAGSYFVTVTNSAGSATSSAATLSVTAAATGPAISNQPSSATAALGGNVSFTVTAPGATAWQWRKNGAPIANASTSTLTLANLAATDAASYDVVVSNASGATTSAAATLLLNAGLTSRLSNVSVRTTLAAQQILIVGLTMQGGRKDVLIRAAGPGLGALGVPGTMTDPKLAVFNGSVEEAANNNWAGDAAVSTAIAAVGAFPFPTAASLDAALVRSIEGGRTVQVSGPSAGNLIVEAYDAGPGNSPRLVNLSALNFVGTGRDILIAGFNIAGTGTKNLLIRAAGPSLAALGVPGTLVDPKLEIFNSAGQKIAENDTYSATLPAVFGSVSAFAFTPGAKDAALMLGLSPGGYTVQVSGADGGSGSAIVEIYELP
jgi:hypothetical protein